MKKYYLWDSLVAKTSLIANHPIIMKKHYLFLFFVLVLISVFGQTQKPPAFVSKVYDDLYRNLYITKKIEKPELIYTTDDNTRIIVFAPSQSGGKSKLIVGSEFVSLLRTFESDSMNALAFVMGHEMAHIFLEQNENIERIGGGYADKTLKKELRQLKDSLYSNLFERQADEYAMFYSHLGGYKTTHLTDKLLDKIYLHFKLPSKLNGYPDLQERKLIASTSALKMKLLLERFEFANLCLVSKKYDIAINMYKAITNEGFKSSEVYNNLGICLMLKVIQSDTIFQKYEWPIFLDSKSKLTSTSQRDLFGIDVKETLNNAIEYLKLASEDKESKLTNLNLSIAHLLLEISKEDPENDHLTDCNYFLEKLVVNKFPQVNTMKGIIAHYTGNIEKAKDILLSNSEISVISKRNYDILFGKRIVTSISENPLSCLLKSEDNLAALFVDPKGIIRDSSGYGSKPLLPSFLNISIDNKKTKSMTCSRIYDKSSKNEVSKVYFAKQNDPNDNITENLLKDYSEFIFDSNLYKFYIFTDWIIKVDTKGIKTIYKTY